MRPVNYLFGLSINLKSTGRRYIFGEPEVSNMGNIKWIYDHLLLLFKQENYDVVNYHKNRIERVITQVNLNVYSE